MAWVAVELAAEVVADTVADSEAAERGGVQGGQWRWRPGLAVNNARAFAIALPAGSNVCARAELRVSGAFVAANTGGGEAWALEGLGGVGARRNKWWRRMHRWWCKRRWQCRRGLG